MTKAETRPQIDIAERNPDVSLNEVQEADEGEASSLDDREDLQKALLGAIRKHGWSSDMSTRGGVESARDARNYVRGMQQFAWSEDQQDIIFGDNDAPYDRVFNITQPYWKIFISTFMGASPKVEPEADNPFESDSVQDTAKARDYERIWRKKNDISELQMEMARLFFTDGRIITVTEDVPDGDDPGQYTRTYGVLESRAGSFLSKVSDWSMFQLEDEYSLVSMKRKYPEKRQKLNSGSGDSYFRNARLAVKRMAGSDTTLDIITGDDGTGLCTITRSFLRPDFFEHLNDGERDELNEMFPDGLCIHHNGETYLESYPYEIDKHVDVVYALPSDGADRPAISDPLMSVQDSVNTAANLIEETFDHGIPTTYYDKETQIDTLNASRNIPGGARKMVRRADQSAQNHFYTTPELNPSAQLMGYLEQMRGEFAQFVTGLPPAIQGFGDDNQKTASGYAQMRQMALGQMAIVWKPFTSWYTREMTRCVKLAAGANRPLAATLDPLTPGGQRRNVKIHGNELTGFKFTNASDENFPETYTERRNAFMTVLQDPDAKGWIMQTPDNLYLAKQLLGLPDLIIPGEDSRNKQLQEIAEMESGSGPQAQWPQGPDGGQLLPPLGAAPIKYPDPRVQWVSSVPVDKRDEDQVEFQECLRWINSPQGQDAKRNTPLWYADVNLHCDAQEAQMKQKAAANAPAPEQKPPSINIAIPLDKFSPDIQAQVLPMIGVQVQPGSQITVPQPTGGAS